MCSGKPEVGGGGTWEPLWSVAKDGAGGGVAGVGTEAIDAERAASAALLCLGRERGQNKGEKQ